MLEQYAWPGNVRELRNVIERATILAPGPFIEPRHLPPTLSDEPPAQHQPQVALGAGHDGRRGRAAADPDDARSTRATTRRAPPKSSASASRRCTTSSNKLRLRPKKSRVSVAQLEHGRRAAARACSLTMRLGIKGKQVLGVTSIVGVGRRGAERDAPGASGAA